MSSPQPFSSCDVVGGPSGNWKKQRYSACFAGSFASVPAPGKDRAHLLLEALRVERVHVVVAVVGEEEPALLDEQLQLLPLLAAEPDQLVARHEQERKREQIPSNPR